jgi:predicted RNA-binding protein with PIN domain
MTFIDFINEYVDDVDFKKTVNSLYEVWQKENPATFESTITPQPQATVSTANTPEQNAAVQQGQQKVEPRTIQGDLNNMNSKQVLDIASRFQEIEKQKEENEKAAQQAQEKLDNKLDDLQQNFNAVANGKVDNVVG